MRDETERQILGLFAHTAAEEIKVKRSKQEIESGLGWRVLMTKQEKV